ncbi:unnamed protein product [Rodentolepis nana]|uniref:Bromo adjacent homology domain-containing 1 protein n=1 Tax=Rodentolepis nana TaxID=102285 RepID=A0A0R3T2V3_RODNA|nr:unnamed protein product [Rodentolepis nana]
MLTRNRGKFKSVVEILGLKKKNKKSSSRVKESSKSESPSGSRIKKVSSIKSKKVARRKNDAQLDEASKLDNEGKKRLNIVGVSENSTETSQFKPTVSTKKLESKNSRQKTGKSRISVNVNKNFALCDPDLFELLGEIKHTGRLFRSRRKYLATKAKEKQQPKAFSPANFYFKDDAQESLFKRLVETLEEINSEMDTKDAVLASCSIVRPGIRKSLRIRRKLRRKNAIDLCKVRLRPNPRRKRFSDASLSDVEMETHSTNLNRGDRNVSLAAKKLAMAKSRAVDERRNASTTRSRTAKFSYRRKKVRSLRRNTVGRRMRVGEVSEDYEDSLSNEAAPVPETQEQPQESTDDPEHTAEEQRRRIMNPQLSLLGRLLLGMHCTAVSGENENEILIKNLSNDDCKMLTQRITGTIFTLKTLSTIKDEESGEEKFNVVLVYLDNAQSIVSDEIARSEDGNQQMLRKKPTPNFSRSKSVREGRKRSVRQAHPLQILGLRHLRAQVEAAKNSLSEVNPDETRASTKTEESLKPELPKSRVLPAFFLNHVRRAPSRRVVRKVYTGSALVPKILHRRRSQATATSSNQPHFALSPQYSQSQTPAVTTLSMPSENTQLPQVHASEVTSSTIQIDKDNEENADLKKEDMTSDKEANSTDAHSICAEQSCINNPASSMSASQLLKLKRQQDDKQNPQPTSGSSSAITTSAVTSLVDTVAKITLSKPIAAIPTLQSTTQKLTQVQGLRIDRSGKLVACSSSSVITLPASTPVVTRANPTTSTLVSRAMTFLVPSISSPVTTIVSHQIPIVSPPLLPHIQAQRPNIVPTKRVPIRSAVTLSAKLPLIPLANPSAVPKMDGSILTSAAVVQTPPATSCADLPSKRPMIHKCHTLRKISPKIPPLPSASGASASPSTLKSILESGSRTSEVVSPTSLTSTQLPIRSSSNDSTFVTTVSQPPVMSTGSRQDNQTPSAHHQSRGTWQVGGRAIVLDVSLNRCSNSTASPAPQ